MLYTVTLKKNHEFRRLYAKGQSAAGAYLVLYAKKTRRGGNRVGRP